MSTTLFYCSGLFGIMIWIAFQWASFSRHQRSNERIIKQLDCIIYRLLLRYPHEKPNAATVAAMRNALLMMASVSNARPARYASEPWRMQSVLTHCEHATKHIADHVSGKDWTDINQPSLGHALLRIAFALDRAINVEEKEREL